MLGGRLLARPLPHRPAALPGGVRPRAGRAGGVQRHLAGGRGAARLPRPPLRVLRLRDAAVRLRRYVSLHGAVDGVRLADDAQHLLR